jgi:hypothetical protein
LTARQKKSCSPASEKLSARQKKSCMPACPKKFVEKKSFHHLQKNGQPDN